MFLCMLLFLHQARSLGSEQWGVSWLGSLEQWASGFLVVVLIGLVVSWFSSSMTNWADSSTCITIVLLREWNRYTKFVSPFLFQSALLTFWIVDVQSNPGASNLVFLRATLSCYRTCFIAKRYFGVAPSREQANLLNIYDQYAAALQWLYWLWEPFSAFTAVLRFTAKFSCGARDIRPRASTALALSFGIDA